MTTIAIASLDERELLGVCDDLTPLRPVTFSSSKDTSWLREVLEARRPGSFMVTLKKWSDDQWFAEVTRVLPMPHDDAIVATLRSVPAFRALAEGSLHTIAQASKVQVARRGKTVIRKNAAWPYVGLVIEGTLANAAGDTGRDRFFYSIAPRELFALVPFLDDGATMGRTIVLSKSAKFLAIPREVLREQARQHPELLFSLATLCAQRLRIVTDALFAQATEPVTNRIASFFLQHATPTAGMALALPPLQTMTQSQIAAAVGTVKEVAARAIARLEQAGGVRRERGHVRYLDRSILETFALARDEQRAYASTV